MIIVTEPLTIPGGSLKRIHVVGQNIARVKRSIREGQKREEPCYTVKHRGLTYWCYGFRARTVRAKQDFDHRLPSGAVVWLETTGALTLLPG